MEPDLEPNLDEFLLARIAEDKRIAVDGATAQGGEGWNVDTLAAGLPEPRAAEHVARFDPARVLAECAAKRGIVLACRAARPDLSILGARPHGMADFPVAPHDQHQLAALTLALLAMPYAAHHDYRSEWRP
jgi:hypothetical protein